jgi:hypothetical protein
MPLQSKRDPDFDARWAAWLARGAAHDRALRHRLAIVVPSAVVVAVGIFLLLLR